MAVALRPAWADDADAIAAIYAPHVLHGVATFEVEAPDAAAMATRMAASAGLHPWLVATDDADGGVIAYAHASAYSPRAAYRWTAETTIYVAPAAGGRGVGLLLYGTLIDALRAQGFAQALARIALPNQGSVALHRRLGFVQVGLLRQAGWKHGRWIDVAYWQRALADPGTPPAEPRRFTTSTPQMTQKRSG